MRRGRKERKGRTKTTEEEEGGEERGMFFILSFCVGCVGCIDCVFCCVSCVGWLVVTHRSHFQENTSDELRRVLTDKGLSEAVIKKLVEEEYTVLNFEEGEVSKERLQKLGIKGGP